ncbi:Glycosyl hydrolases family 6 [Nocardioides terrae]|uniref:Glucanase n=2 Tax=Nocardioides terrae TaxID=574651 RepID=A0A1I1M211_9ACTN|nr:Glycosyl hydrolases family 6 [Nocardioides terrae]
MVGAILVVLAIVVTLVVVRPGGDDSGRAEPASQRIAASSTSSPTPSPTPPPPPQQVSAGRAPKLAEDPVAGRKVMAQVHKKRGWTPGVRFTYQWLLDGKPIPGATRRGLVPTDKMIGRRVRVQAIGQVPGYLPAVSLSKPRTVAPDNPLAGGTWAVYRGPQNGLYPAYARAGGDDKRQLAKIALQPRVTWFTDANSSIGEDVDSYIADQQAESGKDALIQLAFFREWPDGEAARGRRLSGGQQADYRGAVDAVARAIGDARVALVLEPDLGLNAVPNNSWETRTADPAVRLGLVRYAAKRFSELPRTSVYLDASDSDWLAMSKIVPVLEAAGVEYARGFALGATHYSSVGDNIDYGMQIIHELEADGIDGKRFVIDTADNGRPFTWLQHRSEHPGDDFDNAITCRSVSDTTCDTLGVPPTADVAGDLGLDLTGQQRANALRNVDGYLWFGRPWLIRQASPFSLSRSLEVARSTPFQ